MTVTLVSCYYCLNTKHHRTKYLTWLKYYDELKLKNKILYTNAETLKILPSLETIDIRILELEHLPLAKHIEIYREHLIGDVHKTHGHNEWLYLIWNSKPDFVKEAILNGSENHEYYWYDIGMLRDKVGENYNFTPKHIDRISILQIQPFTDEDRTRKPFPGFKYGDVRIGGGCYGGTVKAWMNFLPQWYDVHEMYITNNEFVGQDQRLLATLCLLHPETVNMIYPKTYDFLVADKEIVNGNPWFYMNQYLSSDNQSHFLFEDEKIKVTINNGKNPTVSVIIPTFNRYNMLLESIQSIKEQNLEPCEYEIVVIDDGSTDPQYIKLELNQDIDILIRTTNSKLLTGCAYPGLARNYGMKYARGQYFAFLDDDDIWVDQEKLSNQLDILKQKQTQISITNAMKHFPDGTITPFFPEKFSELNDNPQYILLLANLFGDKIPDYITHNIFLCINLAITSTVMISKNVRDTVGYFRCISDAEDYDYWLRATELYRCHYSDQMTTMYRIGQNKAYSKNPWAIQYMYYNINRFAHASSKRNNCSICNVYPDEIQLLKSKSKSKSK